jgi:putative two-component system response regulator
MDIFLPVKPTILILENSSESLLRLSDMLHEHYTVKAVTGDRSVLQVCSDEQPDLILIDTKPPDNRGFEVCRGLKAHEFTRHIPVIFLTQQADLDYQHKLHAFGAVDYVTRPICAPVLLSRIKAQLAAAASERTQRVYRESLAYEAFRHSRQLTALQDMTLVAVAALAESRNAEVSNHLKRTQHYVHALGQYLMRHPRFCDYLTPERQAILFKCAPLNDIGKVGISEQLMRQPERDEAPQESLQPPARPGADELVNPPAMGREHNEFLEIAREIVYCHHERWDGSGYPHGLAGDAIPVSARLMAIADVYDALISQRVYKQGLSHGKATQIILEGRGKQFDPDVTDAFLALNEVFQGIAARFSDHDADNPNPPALTTH